MVTALVKKLLIQIKKILGSTFIIIKKKEQNTQKYSNADYIDPKGLFERLLKISVKKNI